MTYFKRSGEPYPKGHFGVLEWARDFEDQKMRVVAQEELKNGRWVSTVWLGLDHSFGAGKPMIFETTVFPKTGVYGDIDMARYATQREALQGHKKMVKKHEQESKNTG